MTSLYKLNREAILRDVKNELGEEFMEFVNKYDNVMFLDQWHFITQNINITMDIIEKYPNKPWCSFGILINPNITLSFIENYGIDRLRMNQLRMNTALSQDILERFVKYKYDWLGVVRLTINFIEKYKDSSWWSWWNVSNNSSLTMAIIDNYPDDMWKWSYISRNQNITFEFVQKHHDKPWDWSYISKNRNITPYIIENNPTKPWDWRAMSWNPNMTLEFVKKHLDKPWCWEVVLYNTVDIIPFMNIIKDTNSWLSQQLPRYYWHNNRCAAIFRNDNATFEMIEDGYIDIKNNSPNHDSFVVTNVFTSVANYEERLLAKLKKHLMAFRIQCHWRKCYYNPTYSVCRNRLEKDYDSFYG